MVLTWWWCFSGKDATKVDRSAAYFRRYVAKSLIANELANRVLNQVSYVIALANPLLIHIDSYGSVKEGFTERKFVSMEVIPAKNRNFEEKGKG